MSGDKDSEMSYLGECSTQTGQPNFNAILIEIMESNRTMRKTMEDIQNRESENRKELVRLCREMGQLAGVVQGPKQEQRRVTPQIIYDQENCKQVQLNLSKCKASVVRNFALNREAGAFLTQPHP
ncbi:hypothetical protein K3495_g4269 [Podosphaera aphanis]|nr:hypothetical protein K3495_g4269 [Podosphaera aphanis]